MDKNAQAPPSAPKVMYTKEPFIEDEGPRKIKSVEFNILSGQEILKLSELNVYERNLYQMPERKPFNNGVLDARLGTSNKHGLCTTCNGSLTKCPGHFGYIKLELPVYHVGYFRHTISILQCICKSCSRVLMSEEHRKNFLKKFRNPKLETLQKKALFKKVSDLCKKSRVCHFCGDTNGTVKKVGPLLKIIHDKFAKDADLLEDVIRKLEEASEFNKEIKHHVNKVQDDLNPIRVFNLFKAITPDDSEILYLHDPADRLIITHLPVPPAAIRPSVEMDAAVGSNEDDITMKLLQIIEVNNVLRVGLEKGVAIQNLMENWEFLQVQVAMYINSELPGLPLAFQTAKPMRGFVQRLKGKQGRFRGNLSGKRVDFTGRTVISPDPNLRINEVAVPIHMAMTLTYPERVNRHNIIKLRERVINGVNKYPGANGMVTPKAGKVYFKYGDRRRFAAELKYGDIVERHLEDGDMVLFNRQPSLHRMSIMSHKARVMPWRTLRFNESVCSPYNADFDGDEMNLHVPQTEEAKTEALHLMGVQNNLCTPKNGEILIAATQDFITSAFLITRKDNFYDRANFGLLCSYMNDALDNIDLPTPTILKPVELWTGKQVFSVLVRPNSSTKIFVNLSLNEKNYSKNGESMCVNDGYVLFRNSELLSGQLGKATLGSGNKSGLFIVLMRDYSPETAAISMTRLSKLSARFIGNHGFSIGIDDVQPSSRLENEKQKQVNKGYEASHQHIKNFNSGNLKLQPGCDALQTLESEITGELNKIREEAGKVCLRELHWRNSPLIMSQCGSKGSPINISQMVACVGQQSVGGKRAPNGFLERSLPHFPRNDKTPQAKGFVANSFYSGLTPTEFFFHTMGGREGLVDTAVKTAETGYMSRRLMKALEDLSTHYDGTVRNASGGIVQLLYGDDGMDPVHMEGTDGTPLNLTRLFTKTKATCPLSNHPILFPNELKQKMDENLSGHGFSTEHGCSSAFKEQVSNFLLKEINLVEKTMTDLHLWKNDAVKNENIFNSAAENVNLQNLVLLNEISPDFTAETANLPISVAENVARNFCGITAKQLQLFLDTVVKRYQSKRIEAGQAVGAIGAQSIGEPGTQMTLKTFHFAGVASMNVTLGVPRIKEIINAAKKISTPIITVKLVSDSDVKAARIVKARIEKTTLGEVTQHMKVVFRPGQAYLAVKLDMQRIEALQLDVTSYTVAQSILSTPRFKVKIKQQHLQILDHQKFLVFSPETNANKLYFTLQLLRTLLPKVIVKGIPTVERAVINNLGKEKYNLLVEGTNLLAVLGTEGVDGKETKSNHVMEAQSTLGIEAARVSIMNEINYTMGSHGMTIDARHIMLLADVMTYKGEVLGITRYGIAKMKDSVLMLASFEKTTDHLFEGAVRGRKDEIEGVSECIIMGVPMPIGTGLFKIRQNVKKIELPPGSPLILS